MATHLALQLAAADQGSRTGIPIAGPEPAWTHHGRAASSPRTKPACFGQPDAPCPIRGARLCRDRAPGSKRPKECRAEADELWTAAISATAVAACVVGRDSVRTRVARTTGGYGCGVAADSTGTLCGSGRLGGSGPAVPADRRCGRAEVVGKPSGAASTASAATDRWCHSAGPASAPCPAASAIGGGPGRSGPGGRGRPASLARSRRVLGTQLGRNTTRRATALHR